MHPPTHTLNVLHASWDDVKPHCVMNGICHAYGDSQGVQQQASISDASAGPYLHKAFAFAPSSIEDATAITAPVPSAYADKLDRAALGILRSQLAQFSYALRVADPPASEKYEEAVAALPAPAKLG